MPARYLADKSALVRIGSPEAAWLADEIINGAVARCTMTDLELGYSATDHRNFTQIRTDIDQGCPFVDTGQADWDRALVVQGELARIGHHRAVSLPDLIIAAVAERHQLTVVHYNRDFDHVHQVTGQPMRWVAPRGTW